MKCGGSRKMIKHYNKGISRVSEVLNNIAAIAIFLMMILAVGNVVLRLFGSPIQATYDYVGFLMALGVGFALAYCAVQNGHISVSVVMQNFPVRVQQVIDIVIGIMTITFLVLVAGHMTQ